VDINFEAELALDKLRDLAFNPCSSNVVADDGRREGQQ
jgi:hypothetical protein